MTAVPPLPSTSTAATLTDGHNDVAPGVASVDMLSGSSAVSSSKPKKTRAPRKKKASIPEGQESKEQPAAQQPNQDSVEATNKKKPKKRTPKRARSESVVVVSVGERKSDAPPAASAAASAAAKEPHPLDDDNHKAEEDSTDDDRVPTSEATAAGAATSNGKAKAAKKPKKAKVCIVSLCTAKPTHGFPGSVVAYCASHKEPGTMAKSKKNGCFAKSGKKQCKIPATFGLAGPEACGEHKQAEHVDLVERACTTCRMLDVVGGPNNECAKCYPALNRRLVIARVNDVKAHLRKQDRVNVTVQSVVDGAQLPDSGVKRLPDCVYSTASHHILLFVDTPQIEAVPSISDMHADMRRLLECAQRYPAAGTTFKPLVFFRFNPDNFVSRDKVTSKKFNKSNRVRYEHLTERLNELIRTVPSDEASVLFVFFDDYVEKETRVHSLTASAAMAGGSARYTATLAATGTTSGPMPPMNSTVPVVSPAAAVGANSLVVPPAPTLSSTAVTSTSVFGGVEAVVAMQLSAGSREDDLSEKKTDVKLLFAVPASVSSSTVKMEVSEH